MRCLGTRLMHIFKVSVEVSIIILYPVDISTTALSYSHVVQYRMAQEVHVCYCMAGHWGYVIS